MKKRNMFLGSRPIIFRRARQLREKSTATEQILWERLRGKQLDGFRFRRQHPIGNFIVDFYCHRAKLIVEVDGSIHLLKTEKAYDLERNEFFNERQFEVIRFSNQEVNHDIEDVLDRIRFLLRKDD